MSIASGLLARLNPYARWIKLGAIAMACAALFSAGWAVNGWRLGKAIASKEAARQSALNERQSKAITDALDAVTRSQAALELARKDNARLVREAATKAPAGPEYACRDKPLPEDYLEVYRQ